MRVLSAVGMFTIMPSMGIAMGAQPIIGYNYGARKFGRMKRTLGQGILLGLSLIHISSCLTGKRFKPQDA